MTESLRIYRELKRDIATCTLEPGLSISEMEMCKQYKGSRTPVREACHRLCSESLMQVIPFRGYSIPPLTIEEYRNLNELQTAVEPMAAALAAERATEEQVKEIESWANYDYEPGEKSSYYTFLEWNRNFHICVAAATGNHALLEVVRNVQTRLMRYYYLVIAMDNYGSQLGTEHQSLVRAIRAKNSDLARTRALEHLTNTNRRSAKIDLHAVNRNKQSLLEEAERDWTSKTPVRTKRSKKRTPTPRARKSLRLK